MPKIDWTTCKDRMSDISMLMRREPTRETIDELIEIDKLVTKLWRRLFIAETGKDPLDGQG